MDDDRPQQPRQPDRDPSRSAAAGGSENRWRKDDGEARQVTVHRARGSADEGGNGVTAALPRSTQDLTPAEFYDLAQVPPEVEWFANLTNPNTRRAYKNDVREFMAFAGLTTPQAFRRVNRALVIAWRKDLERRTNRRGEPLAGASIRRKLSALGSLFDFLLESNAVLINPCGGVKRPVNEHAGEGKTPALSDRNARRLLDAPPADTLKVEKKGVEKKGTSLLRPEARHVSGVFGIGSGDSDVKSMVSLLEEQRSGRSTMFPFSQFFSTWPAQLSDNASMRP